MKKIDSSAIEKKFDYECARDLFDGHVLNNIVKNDVVFPHWISGSNYFWYEKSTVSGRAYRLINAEQKKNDPAFDHQYLARLLNKSLGKQFSGDNLRLENVLFSLSPYKIYFELEGVKWEYFPEEGCLNKLGSLSDRVMVFSPDEKKAAYVHDYNLWICDFETGEEYPVTDVGKKHYAFGTGIWDVVPKVDVLWSPDSRYFLTHILDVRDNPSRLAINYLPCGDDLMPKLVENRFGFAGGSHVETYKLFIIDVENNDFQAVNYHPLVYSGYGMAIFDSGLGWWADDGSRVYFVDVERGGQSIRVVELVILTGSTRIVFEEVSSSYVRLCYSNLEKPIFLPLPASDELIWWSERSDWGHLYLYDLNSGLIKRQITTGDWLVREIVHFDPERREAIIHTAGRDQKISPYYRDICVVNIDTGELKTLYSGNFDNAIYHGPFSSQIRVARMTGRQGSVSGVNGVSESGDYIVVTRSRVDTIPETLLLDRSGREIFAIETADVSGLPVGWVWPEPVQLKAADGKTDIYGAIYWPPGYSSSENYPVIDFSMGYRSSASVAHGSFRCDSLYGIAYMWASALAALGFVVVTIEGRGTPYRSKSFQDHRYGDPGGTSDFNDRIAGIRQLADRYPNLDLDRVGITGSDNLGNTIYGMLDNPDFYKVGVIHCYTDPRFYLFPWAEQAEGIPLDGSVPGDFQYAEDRIHALKGKLLLIQGMLDPASTAGMFRLVGALHKANKDFDMICLPSVGHDVSSYGLRRSWDFLVRNLHGIEPPSEFHLREFGELLESNGSE